MDKFRHYELSFSGLSNGKHRFHFLVDEEFFELFNAEMEFSQPKIEVDVILEKHTTFLEVSLRIEGEVVLLCDVSGESFPYHVYHEINVLVKFGEDYDDDHDEVITIPMNSHSFNVAQLIYEAVNLSIPMKKVSPDLDEEEYQELYQKYEFGSEKDENSEEQVDPRWEVLSKLKK